MQNISFFDFIMAHLKYWKHFFDMVLKVRNIYSNSFYVLTNVLKGEFPVKSTLKNGTHIKLESFNAMYVIAQIQKEDNIQYDVKNDCVTLFFPNSNERKSVTIYGGLNNGDIVYGFLRRDYGKLPVKDKTVIDIGANIGDTPIYFVLNGAKRVIGLEPFPKNFKIANKNIQFNNFSDKIILLLAGCAAKSGNIIINPEEDSNIESVLKESDQGIEIPLLTLTQIFKEQNITSQPILKMDCEGCEYDIIKSTSEETLKRFSHIQIEYHSGYINLKKKLEDCGFKITIVKPRATDVINTIIGKVNGIFSWHKDNELDHVNKKIHKIGYAGFIYAVNIKNK